MADLGGARVGRLLRRHRTLESIEPWDLLPRLPERGWAAAWWDPVEERSFVALGLLAELPLSGDDRFDQAATLLRTLNPVEGGEPTRPLPCALAGFAFQASDTRSDEWRTWGDGALLVPRLIVHRVGRRTCAVAATWLDGDAAEAELDDAFHALTSLRSRPLRLPGRAGGVAPSDGPADRAAWAKGVARAQQAFDEGALEKVVLARRAAFRAETDFDPLATVIALREQQPACTAFMVRQADGSAFVGASPEELARVRDRDLATVALAGTRRRDGDDRAEGTDLLHSDKDRREHDFVVDAIVGSLHGVADDVTAADTPSVAPFSQVQHLRTPIRARLADGVGVVDIVARLHPTPAVGGVPRDAAMRWLDEHEDADRGWYAGPLGWASSEGDGVFVVAIRSALLRGPHAAAWAGCGLVEGSEPAAEWRETEAKLAAVRGALTVSR